MGRPHCSRAPDQPRAIFSDHLPAAAHMAGMDRRPVFSVVRAIFRPWPSRPSRLAAGTRTLVNRVTPFSMPRRPMKLLRFSTLMPGEDMSTTNALMPPLDSPCGGTAAITTTSSAITPLVVQSFTPSMTYSLPSSEGMAVVRSRAGSEPTSGSVSRNAVTAPAAQRGRYSSFCSSLPKTFTGSGTPMDWWAETSAPMLGCTVPRIISARP